MEVATLASLLVEPPMNRVLESLAETPLAVPILLWRAFVCGGKGTLNDDTEFLGRYDPKEDNLDDFYELIELRHRPWLRILKLSCDAPQKNTDHLLQDLSSFRPLDIMVHGGLDQAAGVWRKKISAAGNKMTMETSSKGGFDIVIGYYKVHVPKYASVHHPLIQMVLFARTLYDSTLRCLQSVAPKSIVEFNNAEGLVSTKTKAHSPNTVSASKDVENYSITPGKDKNLLRLGEVDYNVDLSTVPVHSGGFAQENVYNLHSLTSAPSSADHGITKAEDDTEHWRLTNVAKAVDKTDVTWVLATAAVHHATGNRDLLSDFTTSTKELSVKAGHGVSMPVCGRGSVITGTVVLQDVWFVPGLTQNLVSVTQLTDLDYNVGFARGACVIKGAADGIVIGKAHVSQDRLFEVDFLKVGPVI